MLRRAIKRLLGIPDLHEYQFASGLKSGGYLLYGLARALKPDVCVEIGSARGLSACLVGQALKENGNGKLYAIDPHEQTDWNDAGSVESLDYMKRHLHAFDVADRVEIVRKRSNDAAKTWDKPIDLLFIDGDHSYEGVKADWEAFTPHVSKLGIVVFHDTTWEFHQDSQWYREDMGVPRFVEELRNEGYPVITIDQFCGISVVQPTRGGVPLLGKLAEDVLSKP